MLALILGIIGFGQLQRLRTDGNRLASQVRQLESELTRARDRVTELSADMRVLLANRIPGIAQLGFGRTLEVNEGYIRSVSFGRAGPEQPISYSLVVQNSGAEPVVPRARILLFDEVGLQTGSAEVGSPDTAAGAPVQALAPGEARTLKGQIETFRAVPPAYFLVQSR